MKYCLVFNLNQDGAICGSGQIVKGSRTSQVSPMDNALPVKFWGLDPLHWIHVKLFVRDVLQLKNYPGFKGKHFNINVEISDSET